MMGYLLTGLVGTAVYAANGSIDWAMATWLCAGAMPAALAGAWLSNVLPVPLLEFGIGALALASGLHAWRRPEAAAGRALLGRGLLVLIGMATGVLSAITGTGGPLVLVPAMMWLEVPVLTGIGLAQAVQLPIAALATAGHMLFGAPDILLGALLGVSLAGGSFAGARLAHRLAHSVFKGIVATVLVAVGALVMLRILAGAVAAG